MKKKRMALAVSFMIGLSVVSSAGRTGTVPAVTFDIVATPFFVGEGGLLKQVLRIAVENSGEETRGVLKAIIGGREFNQALDRIPKGKSEQMLLIPEIAGPLTAKFELSIGSQVNSAEKKLNPQRKWTLYLFHHSHTDIGYTELQTRIYKKHAEYLDDVIQYCRETEDYPDDAKFRWNAEVAWGIDNYIKHRPENKVQELMELVKKGRVEVGAWYLQLSDCFAHEELIRSTYLARELNRKYGILIQSAMNDDVNGFSWAAPQILSKSGVRYFATGINETRSLAPLRRPCAFYWESTDGSRILHWNGEHYLFANYELRIHEGEEKSRPQVEKYLSGLEERGDYPYDLIAFNISAWVTDNCPPGRKLSDVVRDWNARWAFPKLRLATMSEFFGALEKKYVSQIPTYKLGWPDYWTDGVASTAYETGINRLTHNELLTAEKMAAVAAEVNPGFTYPGAEINEGYTFSMLYDEHTWGAYNSIDEPDSELARGQWTIKSEFAYNASEISRTLLKKSAAAIAGRIPNAKEFSVAVFNPLSWERTDVVRVTLPQPLVEKKGQFRLIDGRTGREQAFQLANEKSILFLGREIPALGYAVYSISPDQAPTNPPAQASAAANALENEFYRVTLDPATGGIKSLYDKAQQIEYVDGSSPYLLNQYIYENPEGGRQAVDNMQKRAVFKRSIPASAKIVPGFRGAVAVSLKAQADAPGCRDFESEVVLYAGLKKVEIINRLHKEDTLVPEAVYFAFPFKVDGGQFVFEIADGMMRPELEQLPRTTRDWLTAQHWVEAANADRSIVWSPVEAPLIQLGDINTGKWLQKLDLTNSHIFSYAMNNYWMTNFKASQGGPATFRYAVTTRPGGSDAVQSSRFGWEIHTPLVAVWIPAENKGSLEAAASSFFSLDRPNVIIQAVKKAEDGQGLILRLREIAGKDTEVRVQSPFFQGKGITAALTDMGETNERDALVLNGEIVVPMRAYGIQAVRIVQAR